MNRTFKILLSTLFTTLSLQAGIQRVTDGYVLIQTAGDSYVGNESNQTYSINPSLISSGNTVVIIDQGGTNTIELVGGLTISSSKVVSDELILNLSNGASVNVRGADTFTFDVGANQASSKIGTKQNFLTFVTSTLGLASVPTKGQSTVTGGAVSAIVDGGVSTNTSTTLAVGAVGSSASNSITTALAKSANLSKGLTVFGINLLATSEVPNAKLLHAANIMAELIDNNEDGKADNQAVLDSLISQSAYETMYNLQEGNLVTIDNDILRAVSTAATTLGAYETVDNYADGLSHDASIEEIFHLITQFGYSKVYPAVFEESNTATSTMAQAMDVARGGRVTVMPAGGWVYPSSAWWFYNDQTADYATMMTEYIYWVMTSNVGMHDSAAGLAKASTEWKPNTKAKLQVQDPTMYGLINDPQYAFPTQLPNADYTFYKFKDSDIKTF